MSARGAEIGGGAEAGATGSQTESVRACARTLRTLGRVFEAGIGAVWPDDVAETAKQVRTC